MKIFKKSILVMEGEIHRLGVIAGCGDVSYALRLKGDSKRFHTVGDQMTMEDQATWGVTMALSTAGDLVKISVVEGKPDVIVGFENLSLS